ncbi:NrfD/PsrC family molybdoenzyme membrane anchor subunit, partial [Seleniivibrio woodruffii]|uniref:NrfD/PsrC family molybdoenzyme membrane anchor subunit n=1 Tax=Seleniivibrio woodruffii TaxID=1078050 RepID=UPI0026EEB0C1
HYVIYKGRLTEDVRKSLVSLGRLMGGGIGVMMLLYLWKLLSSVFIGGGDAYTAAVALIKGPLALNFWLGEMILAVAVPLLLIVTAKGNVGRLALSGFTYMIGLFFTRYDFIVAGQLPPMRGGFYGAGVVTDFAGMNFYSPSAMEWLVYLFGFGVFFLLYFSAEKFFNLETKHH